MLACTVTAHVFITEILSMHCVCVNVYVSECVCMCVFLFLALPFYGALGCDGAVCAYALQSTKKEYAHTSRAQQKNIHAHAASLDL